ncbi:DUF389 domain-containing protein [Actinocorallia longicatena]|uniref:DUF389 domain-containing protein n=1 Tax=Actinocorallia longicatena TaxID=111803 RepID=A0ABP6Q2Y3_9ACTN
MLHLRTIVPPELTETVLEDFGRHPGVANVVLLPGAARSPEGDVIQADVARESADEIVEGLKSRGVEQCGSITLGRFELAVGEVFDEAEEAAPGYGDDAVIWQDLDRKTAEETVLTWTFLAFLALATQLAGIAALIDSSVLVVGAMVLGPEFGAVAAISYGLLFGDLRRVGAALRTLAIGFALAIAITFVCAWVSHLIGVIDLDELPTDRPQTGFVYSPDRWSFIVALLAGTAGVLSMTSGKASALVGVFISVTTVPAAGNLAVALALSHSSEIRGSILQLLVNLLGMIIAGIVTLAVQRLAWNAVLRRRRRTQGPPSVAG